MPAPGEAQYNAYTSQWYSTPHPQWEQPLTYQQFLISPPPGTQVDWQVATSTSSTGSGGPGGMDTGVTSSGEYQSPAGGAAGAAPVDPMAAQQAKVTAEIQAFYDSLKGDPTQDPVYQQLVTTGTNAGMMTGVDKGLGLGGLSGQNTQRSALVAAQPYLANRRNLQLQAASLINNRDIGLTQLAQGWTQINNQQEKDKWAAQQGQNQGLGSLIGGIGGAVVGGIATAATGGAAAPLIPGLISGGAGIGGGFGSLGGGYGGGPSYHRYNSSGGAYG